MTTLTPELRHGIQKADEEGDRNTVAANEALECWRLP